MKQDFRKLIYDACRINHPANVLEVVMDYCKNMAQHCRSTANLRAVAAEWESAANHINNAIKEIEQ